MTDIPTLRRILKRYHRVAVVGLSAQWHRPSYFAAKYLAVQGYEIFPVNPAYEQILGRRSYPNLRAIPETIEVVDCFRRAAEIPAIARDAVHIGARVLWTQLGVESEEGARIAHEGGLEVVMNRCMKIEHARLFGGLGWAGVNTGVVSSHRPHFMS